MRVIAGTARGLSLKGPADVRTRATSDKVRGAIFDVLAAWLPGARALDLYAGTGALGIEALSRGAATCLFVEQAGAACRVVEANLRTTRLSERSAVWCMAVATALDRLEREAGAPGSVPGTKVPWQGAAAKAAGDRGTSVPVPFHRASAPGPRGSTFRPPYDVIMLDPPYADPDIAAVVARIGRSGMVARGGFVVLEHGKRREPPSEPGGLALFRSRRYGDTMVTIWQDAGSQPSVASSQPGLTTDS